MAVIKEDKGDAGADAQTQYTMSLGDVFQGTLDPVDDKDLIKVELSAETIYDFSLSGVDGESAELALFDSDGKHIVSGGDIPSGTKLIFSPDVSGIYYIGVGSYDDSPTSDYELSLVENTSPVGTYDEIADYLIDGFQEWQGGWGSTRSFNVGPGGTLTVNATALTEAGLQLARWALEAWSNVTGIKFQLVDHDGADLTFDNHEADYASGYFLVNNGIVSGYVNNPQSFLIKHGATIDSYNFLGYLHELGHALGLGHTGPYSGRPFYYGHHNLFVNDSLQLATMSYVWQDQNTYLNASLAVPVTPMIVDIIAIQKLYGVPDSINTGDTIYGYRSNLDGYLGEFFKLWSGEANPFSGIKAPSNTDTPTIKLALADLDGDGDPDLVVGNDTGLLYYFENIGTADNPDFMERAGTANPLDGLSVGSYSAPAFTDLDGDGDPDLIVGYDYGAIAYFENTGSTSSPGFTQRTGADNPFGNITISAWSTLALADLDGDGDLDLAVGTEGGGIPYYENIGTAANPEFVSRSGASSPLNNINAGFHNTPVFADVDGDKDFDLAVGNREGQLLYFENTGTTTEPSFTPRTDFNNPFLGYHVGYWIGLEFADLNGDGHPDLVVGNQDGIIHYVENTGTQGNPEFSPQSLGIPTTFTIYDNGGNDTLDLRMDTQDQRVYLRPEGISDVYGLIGNVIIARDTWIENYLAGSGDDFIVGNAVANDINGRAGDDRLWGGGGDDILEGGAGADQLDGDAGMDWAAYRESDAAVTVNLADDSVSSGHAEGDVLTEIENVIGSDYDDVLVGNDGANRLEGGGGADRLDGGAGSDWASYRGSNDGVTVDLEEGISVGGHAQGDVITNIENLTGSGFADVLRGDGHANRLDGGGGDDRLWGAGGNDVLVGGEGDDWLLGSMGADQLDGGVGFDVLSYELSDAGVTVNLEEGTLTGGYAQGDVIADIEQVVGSEYRDVLMGDSGLNELYGIGGDDELRGNGGDDVLEGGAGADRLDGGPGLDWLSYAGSDGAVSVRLYDGYTGRGDAEGDVISGFENLRGSAYADALAGDGRANRLEGGAGDDQLSGNSGDDVLEGGAGADRLDGGPGVDWLSYAGSDGAVSVRLYDGYTRRGHAEGDVISGFENIAGSAYPDVLTGDDGPNELAGNGGDDELRGSGGDDILEGGAGGDSLDGDAGRDTLSYGSSDAGVRVNLAAGTAEGGHAEGDAFTGIENITGSDYRDSLTGDARANRLEGAAGDDELEGGSGNDWLIGNLGDDRLSGGAGDDELRGNEGSDRLSGESGADVLHGDEGDDDLRGGADGDELFGGAGADSLYGDEGDDELEGGDGNDRLHGDAGADQLDGGTGIDWVSYYGSNAGVRVNLATDTLEGGHARGDVLTSIENLEGSGYDDVLRGDGAANELHGGDGADELYGNGGDDVLQGGAGADRLDGGSGIDTLSYQDSDEGITVSLVDGTTEGGHAQGDVIRSIENVVGSDYEDVIRGDSGANHLAGSAGDDRLHGGAGADQLDGGEGTDLIEYWSSDAGVTVNLDLGSAAGGHAEGDIITDVENVGGTPYEDILIGDNNDNYLYGYQGDDNLRGNEGRDQLYGGAGADRLDGGGGFDEVNYVGSDTGVTVNLEDGTGRGGHAEGDIIINVEGITGSQYGDVLIGDNGDNHLQGLDGDDEMYGNEGDDFMYGSPGDDTLYGGDGDDELHGAEDDDNLFGGKGDDVMNGEDGDDVIHGNEGNDGIGGSAGDDNLFGDEGNDYVTGDEGNDNVYGNEGDDILEGGAGGDHLDGGAGDDELYGNTWWSDEGDGNVDEFVFAVGHGDDTIHDFTDNEDKVDLSAFNLAGFDDLSLSSDDEGTTIDLSAHGGGTILLAGFDMANLDATDFLF